MPSWSQLPLDALPAWARLNDVAFTGVKLQHIDGKGSGLVADTDLDAGEAGSATLLRVPHDLALSAEAVEEYAKVDQNFRRLKEAVGYQSTRRDVMLYLLCHLAHCRRGQSSSRGITSTPWTEYMRFLPRPVPVPTMWSEPERLLLNGTSLEAALEAKLSALANEFDELREKTEDTPFWHDLLWERDAASLNDWVLADAWYRSRCLELPQMGDAMVPGLDMANHSSRPAAYYEVDVNRDVVLVMRPSHAVSRGQEVAISYGEAKPAAETLFSYGFVDRESTARGLTLRLDPFPDDPLAAAKLDVFDGLPVVRLSGDSKWDSPFVYLMCLNEEDGLEFRLLQDTAGQRQLRLLWQGDDVTERAGDLETLIQDHQLSQVFRLRAVAVLHERVGAQLARIKDGPADDELQPLRVAGLLREECIAAAKALREVEAEVLQAAAQMLEEEKSILLADERVVAYLGSMEDAQNDQAPRVSSTNQAEDFS